MTLGSTTPMNHRSQLKALAEGSEAAFAALYLTHKDAVYRFAVSLSSEHAEDVVSEVFLNILRKVPKPMEVGELRARLLLATRHRTIDLKRRAKVREPRRMPSCASRAEEAWPTPAEGEREAQIRAAVDRLPTEQAEVVRLRVFGDLDFADIATTQEAPLATVRNRWRAALSKLKLSLQGSLSDA